MGRRPARQAAGGVGHQEARADAKVAMEAASGIEPWRDRGGRERLQEARGLAEIREPGRLPRGTPARCRDAPRIDRDGQLRDGPAARSQWPSSSSSARSCPRISPPGLRVEWTLAYTAPLRIARTTSANSPGAMPWPAGPMTSAGVMVPVTVPPAGGHAGLLPPLQRNAMTPPLVARAPR